MSDLKAPVPVQTRRANEGVQPRGHRQTTLSEEAQRDLKLKRDSARIQRTRALLKAAQDRLLAHLAILDEALIGSGPEGCCRGCILYSCCIAVYCIAAV